MNRVFFKNGVWYATWQGVFARATFNSEGAARAWIAVCDAQRRFRA